MIQGENVFKFWKPKAAPQDLCPEPLQLNLNTSSSNNLDVPVRFSIPRWGMYETHESIKSRLAAACAVEGLSVVDKEYLADLETVAKYCYEFPASNTNISGQELEATITRLQKVWQNGPGNTA